MPSAATRKPYLSDVSEEEWFLVAAYLTLMKEAAPQREYPTRKLFNPPLPYPLGHGLPGKPEQFATLGRGLPANAALDGGGHFETLGWDLRTVLRLAAGRKEKPAAAIIDSRTLRWTPESGPRTGYDGAKRKRGAKVHFSVDTLGQILSLHVTPVDVVDHAAIACLAADVQKAMRDNVTLALVDQGYTSEAASGAAQAEGIRLNVVKLPDAKRGLVLLPRRWVVERSSPGLRVADAWSGTTSATPKEA